MFPKNSGITAGIAVSVCCLSGFWAASRILAHVQTASKLPLVAFPGAVNLGFVAEGTMPVSDITLTNTSGAVLHVSDVSTSCGCTAAKLPPTIPAHGSATLHVSYLSENRVGDVGQSISVSCAGYNDPLRLAVHGTVRKEMTVSPEVVSVPGTFTLTRSDGNALSVIGTDAPAYLRVVKGAATDKQASFSVLLKDDAPLIAGTHQEEVTVHTNHPGLPIKKVPIEWQVKGVYGVAPNAANLGAVPLGETARQTIRISGADTNKLRVVSAPSGVNVRLSQTSPGASPQGAALQIAWQAQTGMPLLRSRVELSTGNPKEPRVIIPIYAAIQYRGDDCTAVKPCGKVNP